MKIDIFPFINKKTKLNRHCLMGLVFKFKLLIYRLLIPVSVDI